jgi:hypothetical protein
MRRKQFATARMSMKRTARRSMKSMNYCKKSSFVFKKHLQTANK